MEPTNSGATPYILVVEDEEDLSQMLRLYFEALGYRVDTFGDGASALRQVIAEDVDVVICDMVMPHMAGDMFYLAVQKLKPAVCDGFVFITGHGTSPGIKDFLHSVSHQVISKPFNVDDLGAAVRQAVVRRRGTSDEVVAG